MAVNLVKGNRVNLTKDTGLKKALIGLGWDINRFDGSADFDLDLVLFECDQNSRIVDDDDYQECGIKIQSPSRHSFECSH